MTTFVLVHGAWHGARCWRRVAAHLRDRGHEVVTPTLTGLGERSHLPSPEIDVGMHIFDVIDALKWVDLADVVLCGHSYGGMAREGPGWRFHEPPTGHNAMVTMPADFAGLLQEATP